MSKYVEYVPECCYTCEYVPHVREYARIRELGGHVLNLRICGSRISRVLTKAIIMMVVCTGTMKINFFAKDPQALAGGTGII